MPDSGRGSAEEFPFLRTQFLDQPLNAENYETTNLTASIELQSSDSMKYYFDATINDQQSVGTSSRAFFSGTGGNPVIDNTTNTGFETINLGTVDGRFGTLNLGEVQVVTSGILGVGSDLVGGRDRIDPNLRTGNNNSSRLTTSRVFAFGGEYTGDRYELVAEVAYSDSETDNPSLNSSLDFINPNGPEVGPGTLNDNGTPAIFNIANNTFEFGIAPGLPESPTTQQLLDPSNYAIRSIGEGLRTREASEAAFRLNYTYDVSDKGTIFTDINAGYRWNKTTNTTNNASSNNSFGNWDRPRADLFLDIITAGANNFNGADDRELFIADYLIIDNIVSFNNPAFVTETLNNAIIANNALAGSEVNSLLSTPTTQISSFFDITEKTNALYFQGNYEIEWGDMLIGGNIGARYVSTDLTSEGTIEVGGVVTPTNESSSYQFFLPRLNIAAEVMDDMIVRVGIGKDIRRPNFDSLSTSANFGASASGTVAIGNPGLEPEQIWSYDLAMEYYFSPSSFVSIGFFHKERTDLITTIRDEPAEPTEPKRKVV